MDDVPREWEEGWGPNGAGTGEEGDTYRRVDEADGLSAELKDCLLGAMLRKAREKWEGREWPEGQVTEGEQEGSDQSGSGSDYQPDGSENEEGQDLAEANLPSPSVQKTKDHPPSMLKPVISTDDDRSRRLLEPTINHMLTQLDKLLLSLHHARNSWTRIERRVSGSKAGSSRASSLSRADIDEDGPEIRKKRSQGWPRKYSASMVNGQDQGVRREHESNDEGKRTGKVAEEIWRAKLTNRGRPRKQYPRLNNETEEEYLVRIARMQKKPLPSFAPPLSSTPSRSRSRHIQRGRSPVKKISTSEENERTWRRKLGLRDWSEVLGMAGIVGFDTSAVERATKRCVGLFGEGMDFLVLREGAADAVNDSRVRYQPDMIPDLGALGDSDPGQTPPRKRVAKRTTIDACPIPDCERKGEPFSKKGGTRQKLEKHLKVKHGLGVKDVEYLMADSDEEMEGGVHVDRFLRPVVARRGWRGSDVGPRKERRGSGKMESGSEIDEENRQHDLDMREEGNDSSSEEESDALSDDDNKTQDHPKGRQSSEEDVEMQSSVADSEVEDSQGSDGFQ